MADLGFVSASVQAYSSPAPTIERGLVGAHGVGQPVLAGHCVYLDSTRRWQTAKAYHTGDAGMLEARVRGIALNGGSENQPIAVQTGGDIDLGVDAEPGRGYFLSVNQVPGTLSPDTDLADLPAEPIAWSTFVAIAIQARRLRLRPVWSDAMLPGLTPVDP